MRLYLMFMYVDGKPYNSMGIKGTVDELFDQAAEISKDIYKTNPKAEVHLKLKYWD